MTKEEAYTFIENLLKGAWPYWKPTPIELDILVPYLEKLDRMKAKDAFYKWLNSKDDVGVKPFIGQLRAILNTALPYKAPDHETYLPDDEQPATRAEIDALYVKLMDGPDTAMRKVVEKLLTDKRKELHDAELKTQGIKPEDELVEKTCDKCQQKYTVKASWAEAWCPACVEEHCKWAEQELKGDTDGS